MKFNRETLSPWTVLSFTMFTAILINAAIILGLVRMSSALQIAVMVTTLLLIILGVLFSFVRLNRSRRTTSVRTRPDNISTTILDSAVKTVNMPVPLK